MTFAKQNKKTNKRLEQLESQPENWQGRTTLDEAIAADHFEKVRSLLQSGSKPTQGSLQIACSKGYLPLVKELTNHRTFDYNAALMQTITKGKIEIVQYLVNELGAEVNFIEPPVFSTDPGNLTPLILAFQYKQPAIARFLIATGADPEKTKADYTMSDLGFAAFLGDTEMVTGILANKNELESSDKEGCTPLMRAVQNGNPQLVKQLIAAGANVNAKQKNGNTALIDAVCMRNKAVVDILLCQDNLETEATTRERYYTAREIALINKELKIVQAIDLCKTKRLVKSELATILSQYLDKKATQAEEKNQTKEFLHARILDFFQKFYSQKKEAVKILHQALNGQNVDLTAHLATLSNGSLGKQLRTFIRSGKADCLVGSKVETVSGFITLMHAKVNLETHLKNVSFG